MNQIIQAPWRDFNSYRGVGGHFAAHQGVRFRVWQGAGVIMKNPLQFGIIGLLATGAISGPHGGHVRPGAQIMDHMVSDPRVRADPKTRENPIVGMPPRSNARYRPRAPRRRGGWGGWNRRTWGGRRRTYYRRRRTYRRKYY